MTDVLEGSVSVMPLEELLQWVDNTSRRGVVHITRADGFRVWLELGDREVRSASGPVIEGPLADWPEPKRRAATREALFDLFLSPLRSFRYEPDAPPPPGGIALSLPIAFLAMDGLRLRDEWAELDARYPEETARLSLKEGAPARDGEVHAAIIELARRGSSLGAGRVELGLSRPAMLRRVNELVEQGVVEVDGAPAHPGADPIAQLLASAESLLAESQWAEAAHVFRTLLAADPLDARARQALALAERREVDELIRALPDSAVLRRVRTSAPGLADARRAMIELADEKPVGWTVLASSSREVETRRLLAELVKSGQLRVAERKKG